MTANLSILLTQFYCGQNQGSFVVMLLTLAVTRRVYAPAEIFTKLQIFEYKAVSLPLSKLHKINFLGIFRMTLKMLYIEVQLVRQNSCWTKNLHLIAKVSSFVNMSTKLPWLEVLTTVKL